MERETDKSGINPATERSGRADEVNDEQSLLRSDSYQDDINNTDQNDVSPMPLPCVSGGEKTEAAPHATVDLPSAAVPTLKVMLVPRV